MGEGMVNKYPRGRRVCVVWWGGKNFTLKKSIQARQKALKEVLSSGDFVRERQEILLR